MSGSRQGKDNAHRRAYVDKKRRNAIRAPCRANAALTRHISRARQRERHKVDTMVLRDIHARKDENRLGQPLCLYARTWRRTRLVACHNARR